MPTIAELQKVLKQRGVPFAERQRKSYYENLVANGTVEKKSDDRRPSEHANSVVESMRAEISQLRADKMSDSKKCASATQVMEAEISRLRSGKDSKKCADVTEVIRLITAQKEATERFAKEIQSMFDGVRDDFQKTAERRGNQTLDAMSVRVVLGNMQRDLTRIAKDLATVQAASILFIKGQ